MSSIQVYTADSVLRNPRVFICELLTGIISGCRLGWVLFTSGIKRDHRKTILGFFWVAIPPIIGSFVFFKLHLNGVLKVGDTHMPYALYVLIGIYAWQNFTAAFNDVFNVIKSFTVLIKKVRFAWEALVVVTFLNTLLRVFIQVPIIIMVCLYLGRPFSLGMLYYFIPTIGLIFLGIFLGSVFMPIRIISQDFNRFVGYSLRWAFFLTPIIYQTPDSSFLQLLNKINPVVPFLTSLRSTISFQPSIDFNYYLTLLICSVIGMVISFIIFRIAMPIFIERMGA